LSNNGNKTLIGVKCTIIRLYKKISQYLARKNYFKIIYHFSFRVIINEEFFLEIFQGFSEKIEMVLD
jgi:hypothetical protein